MYTEQQIKEAAERLFLRKITYRWVSTDMGSGYEFELHNPFPSMVWDSVLAWRNFLDIYEGPDEEDDYPEDELKLHYQHWKDSVLEWAMQSFIEQEKEKHFHRFEEFVLQAIEEGVC